MPYAQHVAMRLFWIPALGFLLCGCLAPWRSSDHPDPRPSLDADAATPSAPVNSSKSGEHSTTGGSDRTTTNRPPEVQSQTDQARPTPGTATSLDSVEIAELERLIERTADPIVRRLLMPHLANASSAGVDIHREITPSTPDATPETSADSTLAEPIRKARTADAITGDADTGHGNTANQRNVDSRRQLPEGAETEIAASTISAESATPDRISDDRASRQPATTPNVSNAAPDTADNLQSEEDRAWDDLLTATILSLEDELRSARESDDSDQTAVTKREKLLRMLRLIADQREAAVEPIDGLGNDERDFWKELLYALTVYLDEQAMPIGEKRSTLALQHFRRSAALLSASSALEVRNIAFCTRVDSFGRYEPFESYEFRSDQEVILYVEIDNFASEQRERDGQFETILQGSYEIRDVSRQRVAHHTFQVEQEICRNRRRDFFIPYIIYMPKVAPGRYTLQVTMQDLKNQRIGQSIPVEFVITR